MANCGIRAEIAAYRLFTAVIVARPIISASVFARQDGTFRDFERCRENTKGLLLSKQVAVLNIFLDPVAICGSSPKKKTLIIAPALDFIGRRKERPTKFHRKRAALIYAGRRL